VVVGDDGLGTGQWQWAGGGSSREREVMISLEYGLNSYMLFK
jgi:hypothetical protein